MRAALTLLLAAFVPACAGVPTAANGPSQSGYLAQKDHALILYAQQADRDSGREADCVQLLPGSGVLDDAVPAVRVVVSGHPRTTNDWDAETQFISSNGFAVERERCDGLWMWASAITADPGE